MDFELTGELKDIQKVARDFAVNEILPTADEDDKAHRFRRDLVEKMGELGFLGCVIPEDYEGTEMENGFLASAIICEEMARVHSSMRLPVNMNTLGPALAIYKWGNEKQRKKYIPKLVNAEHMGCFAITEPDAGSDVAAMKTKAVRDGDYYVVNGSKMWISNAPVAEVGLLYAYTNPEEKGKGISAFVFELDNPGITVEPIKEKMGTWAAPVGSIYLENARIPAENLLGNEGEGFKICMDQLDDTRLGCCAGAVGVAQGCIDAALQYCNEREQFGRPIGKFQMNQDMVAQMIAFTESARMLVYRAANLKDKGEPCTRETSIAKYVAGEAANQCAEYAMKILGAYGYSEEYPVARFYRDAKTYQIVEGTSNIQKMIIASDALGYRKANRR